jgi:hypothetical protein
MTGSYHAHAITDEALTEGPRISAAPVRSLSGINAPPRYSRSWTGRRRGRARVRCLIVSLMRGRCLIARSPSGTNKRYQFAVTLPRQRSDFRCLHFVVEYKTISVVLHFEYSFNSEVVAVAQGRRFLSINNNAAATSGSLRPLREVPLVSAATLPSRVTC